MKFERVSPPERIAAGEKNDCTVRAVSAACNVSYFTAHELLARAGRKRGRGMFFIRWMDTQKELLGHPIARVPVNFRHFSYGPTLAQVAHLLRDGRYIVVKTGHAFAVVDGVQHDLTPVGSRSRVCAIWRVDDYPEVKDTLDCGDESNGRY